jgi:16S rRNA (guanine527-N7)-methyltransferase
MKPAELDELWQRFAQEYNLDEGKIAQFQKYLELLLRSNEQFNLTAIVEPRLVIKNHFMDSLSLARFYDLKKDLLLCDIGAGAGFPGLALKIAFPHLKMILIEVNKKKGAFLQEVVTELGLSDVEVCDLDFRTFIRTVEAGVDLFVSRASLDALELCRLFKPGCRYNGTTLVYWASDTWEAVPLVESFIERIEPYSISSKKRKLVFFAKK